MFNEAVCEYFLCDRHVSSFLPTKIYSQNEVRLILENFISKAALYLLTLIF
jgi:hypothetical protein